MIKTSAPGKMILLGEYAVLEGAPALVCAVNRRASVHLQPLEGSEFSVQSPSLQTPAQPFIITPGLKIRFDPNLKTEALNKLHFFKVIFESILNDLKNCKPLTAVDIKLETDAFYSVSLRRKLGFGSSSALTAALAKAVSEAAGLPLDEAGIFRLALTAHRAAQGSAGSGIDIAACSYGGVLEYKMDDPKHSPHKLNPWNELPLAVVWTGASASTSRMVQSVSVLKQANPKLYNKIMEELKAVSAEGIEAYKEQQLQPFLKAVQNFYSGLKKLGSESKTAIISRPHQILAETALLNGGFYKPSGAGGGDIGLLFASSFEQLEVLKEKTIQQGFKIVTAETAVQGAETH